jgi:hypothetical protein
MVKLHMKIYHTNIITHLIMKMRGSSEERVELDQIIHKSNRNERHKSYKVDYILTHF